MVGIVVVSHSRALAEAAVELALGMARDPTPPICVAAGLPDGGFGTDAVRVKAAIEEVASPDGVLVLMDLGSAVLSAEMALELIEAPPPVVLSAAPLVEGLITAVVLAASGATLAEVAADVGRAADSKGDHLSGGDVQPDQVGTQTLRYETASAEVRLVNPHGIHARPAAELVSVARSFDARVTVANLTTASGQVDARSLSALSTLGAVDGHVVRIGASGPEAAEAVASIVTLIESGFGEAGETPRTAEPGVIPRGPVAASPGIGIGPKWSPAPRHVEVPAGPGRGVDAEWADLRAAIAATAVDIRSLRGRVASSAGPEEAAIFDAHLLLLEDEALLGPARARVEHGANAAQAWRDATDDVVHRFSAIDDPYLRERARDVDAVGSHVLRNMLGGGTAFELRTGVLVAGDLTPDEMARLDPRLVTGIVTVGGSPTSHAAILARALGIPAVVGAGRAVAELPDGVTLVVDGDAADVVVDPDPGTLERYRARAETASRAAAAARLRSAVPATTSDGRTIEVAANIGAVGDAEEAVANGADAVGLLRTEFLFLDRTEPPGEDEQVEHYTAILDALGGRRLTIRTLDVGGDKPLAYGPQRVEANPFLGRRGLRLSLTTPELLETQLRAVLRVAAGGPVSVMFPMVTSVEELRRAREHLARAAETLGLSRAELPESLRVGIMVEVPAAALRAAAFAPIVDFFSIGTNDLTQYTMAAERGNASVADLADSLDPAVLGLIASVRRGAPHTPIAVCGEVAAQPEAAPILIGLGVDELSMTPRAVPGVKDAIRATSIEHARRLASAVLEVDSAAAVRALLASRPQA